VTGDVLDIVLVVAAVLFAISGYRQGFVVGVASFVGFIGGGVLGARIAPDVSHALGDPINTALFGLICVFVVAFLGQLVLTFVGSLLRRGIRWRPARLVDNAGGAIVSGVSVLLVSWLVGTAIANSSLSAIGRQVRHSAILTTIDDLVPEQARTWDASFRQLLAEGPFPQVFGSLRAPPVTAARPPDPAVLHSGAVQTAKRSIVKVLGVAPSCSRQIEGSGFVYAPQHVLTNAHVVAGVSNPRVFTAGGASFEATVVLYDPDRDVAVLSVPGLTRSSLHFAGLAQAGDSAIVAGYPQNNPFDAVSARIRGVQRARGPNIYQSAQVVREIYSLYATVRPGNSGGPLLKPDGTVYGVVFAASKDDPRTGYALTSQEVAPDARQGADATTQVGTGRCD
jgi:S1-C subfamily serine protease